MSYCIANIYKWNEEFFILIVPDPQEDGINLCSGLVDVRVSATLIMMESLNGLHILK